MSVLQAYGNSMENLDTKMFDVMQNPDDGRFIVKKTDDLTKIGLYTIYVRFMLTENNSVTISGKPFIVNILSPCTPARLELYGKWPLICPKPEPAKIQYTFMPGWMKDLKD